MASSARTSGGNSSSKPKLEIVVFSLVGESECTECGAALERGDYLIKQDDVGLCIECADLGDLVFLPSGDAALTRRAGKYSRARVIVVRWARARKRYERRGSLVEEDALLRAEEECLADADARARQRERAAGRRAVFDREYAQQFAARVRELYPGCPKGTEQTIADWTCRKHTGRIGRSAAAKSLDEKAVALAVRAHIRHCRTDYDELLFSGVGRGEARGQVAAAIQRVLGAWSP